MRRYLRTADILVLHALQIERFGGADGLRDAGQLEAALFRPQTGYYSDIIAEAAALWESLSQNHPFIDGNKRTALAGMLTFLILNGYDIDLEVTHDDLWSFLNGLYSTHSFKFEHLEPWLRDHARSIIQN